MGKDEIQVHEGRRAGAVVSVRLGPDDAELLMALRRRHDGNLSEVLRRGLHALERESSIFGPQTYTGGTASEFEVVGAQVITGELATR